MTSETTILERFEDLEKRFLKIEEEYARKDADNKRLLKENGEKDDKIKNLEAQLAWFRQQMFGRKSEKRDPYAGQPGLFPEFNEGPKVPEQEQERNQNRRRRTESAVAAGGRCGL